MGLFGSEDDEEAKERQREEQIEDILDKYDDRLEAAGIDKGREEGHLESREYRQYKRAEEEARRRNWYERLVERTAFFRLTFDEMERGHINALRLLGWDIDEDQIAPAALVVSGLMLIVAIALMMLPIPTLFRLGALSIPFIAFYYMLKYPNMQAQKKVVEASSELIEAVLYMAIYMRSSPSLEGAVSFAVRHLDGPVARDLGVIMWKTDVREYMSVQAALNDYVQRWRPYNKGFVESVNILVSAIREADPQSRNDTLTEAINRLLTFTQNSMEDFVEDLRLPVMMLYGIGILLPVLGIILFPLIGAFMGGGGMVWALVFLYNVLLPVGTYALMRNLLVARPVSFSGMPTDASSLNPGKISIDLPGRTINIPSWLVGGPLFVGMMLFAAPHLLSVLSGGGFPIDPPYGTLFVELLPVMAVAYGAGLSLTLGYSSTLKKQRDVREIEREFPEALYQLANNLARGQPIEIAITNIGDETGMLRITDMFNTIARNIHEMGMGFHDAVFDPARGAIAQYPSSMIRTVMEIIDDAVGKGPKIAAESVRSISEYLKNIEETQGRLEEMIGDTLSSLKFLGFILAPVIAGVAVGMGGVISLSFGLIGDVANQTEPGDTPGGDVGSAPTGTTGFSSVFNVNQSIPPGALSMVVGFYLIQLSLLIGSLYVRLDEGENPIRQKLFTGKLMMTAITIYIVVVSIIYVTFSGILQGISL